MDLEILVLKLAVPVEAEGCWPDHQSFVVMEVACGFPGLFLFLGRSRKAFLSRVDSEGVRLPLGPDPRGQLPFAASRHFDM